MKGSLLSTVRRTFAILCITVVVHLVCFTPGYAHGGVVIDTGFTDHFEWLVSINPYPTLMGEATLTLLVYDIATYEPVNDLTVMLYLAAPGDAQPCCQPESHGGPFELIVDPQIYPGDYSNVVSFDQPGEWQLKFVATAPETMSAKSFELVVPLQVNATMGGSQPIAITAESTPDLAATSTVFAQNVAEARRNNSPLAAPASPLTTPGSASPAQPPTAVTATGETNWWLWGGLGLLPIVLIGWFILGASPRDKETSDP